MLRSPCFVVWGVQRCAVFPAGAAEEGFLCTFTADNLSREQPKLRKSWSLKLVFFTIQRLHVFVDAEWMLEKFQYINSCVLYIVGTVCELVQWGSEVGQPLFFWRFYSLSKEHVRKKKCGARRTLPLPSKWLDTFLSPLDTEELKMIQGTCILD